MNKDKEKEIDHISSLLAKRFFDETDSKEEAEIEEWAESGRNRHDICDMLNDRQYVADWYKRSRSIDVEGALDSMKHRIQCDRYVVRWLKPLYAAAAAVVVALISVTAVYYYERSTAVEPLVIAKEVKKAIDMSNESGRSVANVEVVAKREIKRIVSNFGNHTEKETDGIVEKLLEAKRITTCADREYWVTLPDGSLVHLNYDSRLIYPERFLGDTRDVIVEGEAYFMIAKDLRHPFIVHTPDGEVKEYGTEFNVDTRAEGGTSVVLVNGSISVIPDDGRERMMRPGERSTLNGVLTKTEPVDVEPYVAWNTGQFVFDDCELRRIMTVIGRWYGYDIVFTDESVCDMKFSGSFSRYDPMSNAIESISLLTGFSLQTQGGRIIISDKFQQ